MTAPTDDLVVHAPAITKPTSRTKHALVVTLIVLATLAFGVLGAVISTAPPGSEPRTPTTSLGGQP